VSWIMFMLICLLKTMSSHKIRLVSVSTQRERVQSALIKEASAKVHLLYNTSVRFTNLGDGMIVKISSNKC